MQSEVQTEVQSQMQIEVQTNKPAPQVQPYARAVRISHVFKDDDLGGQLLTYIGKWRVFIDSKSREGSIMIYIEVGCVVPWSVLSKSIVPVSVDGERDILITCENCKGSFGILIPCEDAQDSMIGTSFQGRLKISNPSIDAYKFACNQPITYLSPQIPELLYKQHFLNSDFLPDDTFEITEFVDGSCCIITSSEDRVFSVRGKFDTVSPDSAHAHFGKLVSQRLYHADQHGISIYGEIIGPGIKNNRYDLREYQYLVYDIYDHKGETPGFMRPKKRQALVLMLGLSHVPVCHACQKIESTELYHASAINRAGSNYIDAREGNNMLPMSWKVRRLQRGVVAKCNTRDFSFKILYNSNPYSTFKY